MKYIPSVITDTMTQFSPVELSQLLKEFLQALPPERLVKQKLDCIKDLVHSDIYKKKGKPGMDTPNLHKQSDTYLHLYVTRSSGMSQIMSGILISRYMQLLFSIVFNTFCIFLFCHVNILT